MTVVHSGGQFIAMNTVTLPSLLSRLPQMEGEQDKKLFFFFYLAKSYHNIYASRSYVVGNSVGELARFDTRTGMYTVIQCMYVCMYSYIIILCSCVYRSLT